MTEITADEAFAELRKYGTAVHCELYRSYEWYKNDSSQKFYYDRGCVIVFNDYNYNDKQYISCAVHQTSPDAEIEEVTEAWRTRISELAKAYDDPVIWLYQLIISNGELTPQKNQYFGWRNYTRIGYKCDFDRRVRIMTADDAALIKEACTPCLENDTFFGKNEAENFIDYIYNYYDIYQTLYGIFDGERLAGLASCTFVSALDLAWLLNIYVLPDYRQKGYGKALVLSALSKYPDKKWHYQAARDNEPSVALCKSLGFTLEGAALMV